MNDNDRKKLPLKAVCVRAEEKGDEYYEIGCCGVTSITWAETNGHMAPLLTVQVWKDGALHSEHLFANVLGVYYKQPMEGGDAE